jgi:hypothetical protein
MPVSLNLTPLVTLARAAGLFARGRVRRPRGRIGEILKDGEDFIAFRHLVVTPGKGRPSQPGAILRIRFLFKKGSPETNKRLSLIPIPFIIGVPGFRSKLWTLGLDSGAFQGIYEWDSIAAAEVYLTTFAVRLMKMRAQPESLWHEIAEE